MEIRLNMIPIFKWQNCLLHASKLSFLFCCFLNLPYFPILLDLRYKNVLNGGTWHLSLVQYCLQDTSISLFFMEQLYPNTNRVVCGGSYGLIVYSGLIWKIIGHSASPRALLLPYQAFIPY